LYACQWFSGSYSWSPPLCFMVPFGFLLPPLELSEFFRHLREISPFFRLPLLRLVLFTFSHYDQVSANQPKFFNPLPFFPPPPPCRGELFSIARSVVRPVCLVLLGNLCQRCRDYPPFVRRTFFKRVGMRTLQHQYRDLFSSGEALSSFSPCTFYLFWPHCLLL